MRYFDYSHRHGKELVLMLHPSEYDEIVTILTQLEPFPHGVVKNENRGFGSLLPHLFPSFTEMTFFSPVLYPVTWNIEKKILDGYMTTS